jgi:predicted CXXCH cytochrome family protein
MTIPLNRRIVYGALAGALLAILAFVAIPTASAAPLRQDATPEPNTEECVGCHEGLRGYWEESAHGYALVDPIFQEAWRQQGSPQECLACHSTGFDPETGEFTQGGVGCLTCHSPVPGNHPDAYMPTDVSSRLCGNCHLDTFNEWEISEHGQQGMTCNQCHNPHTAKLRVVNSQELCNSCHNTEGHYYTFTGHAREGLLCTDCHLRVNDSPDAGTMGHGEREHTFRIDLKACNDCHLDDMHAEADQAMTNVAEPETDVACYPVEEPTDPAASTLSTEFIPARQEPTAYVSPTPTGPGPLIYILPIGVGLVFGAMFAPWLERLSKRRRDRGEKS